MKRFCIILSVFILCITLGICFVKPVMHKQISFSVIDYIVKFNTDGSMTTIKQTTTTKLKHEDKK